MRVDAYASLPHYAEHLWPIWQALPAEHRGTFYSPRGPGADWWADALIPRRWPDRSTLMLVAAYADAAKVRPRPLVYVEHGAGQTYVGDARSVAHPAYAGGDDLADVALFVCPNEQVAARWIARYPHADVAVVGCPKLDRWHAAESDPFLSKLTRALTVPMIGEREHERIPRTVAVTFHWECGLVPETRSAWPHYDPALETLVDEAARRGWRVLGHGHPRLWGRIERRWRQLGVEHTPLLADVLDQADVLVADNTSAMWEFASLDRPLVVCDAPWYRRDVEHGLRFWTHADAGVRIDRPEHLVEAVAFALDDPGDVRQKRRRASSAIYAYADGHAAERAARAIVDRLENPMPNPFAPRRRRSTPETRSDVELLADRLRTLGASEDAVTGFLEAWGEAAADGEIDDDDRARLRELVRLDDVTLRRMLAAADGGDPDELDDSGAVSDLADRPVVMGVTDLGDEGDASGAQVPQDAQGDDETSESASGTPETLSDAQGAAEGEPDEVSEIAAARVRRGDGVRPLLEWVGDDVRRARAVDAAERIQAEREQRDVRKTLVDGLSKVTGG